MHKKIRKAVFPVAGMGTRFLPATKASPKEMLPVVDKPLIQYAAEEAVAAGIDVLVFITGRTKRSITDHFDKAYELETEMEQRGKEKVLDLVRGILPAHVSCVYIRQAEALGLGHAVGCARPVVGDDPFAVILADDLVDGQGSGGALKQMVDIYDRFGCSVLGVEEVPPDETHKYGVVTPEDIEPDLWAVKAIVEKPDPRDAPSNMAVVGRYILTPRIFDLLETTSKGAGGEIQLTDAIAALLKEEQVLAHRFKGKRYDCGSKLGYLQATVEYALKHPELRDDFGAYINTLCADRLTGS
ncbi:UTP--glucose-1-phosphate uridylyltransferase GalU [Thioalkalivibrio thiocyanodenitrificans]|uniref:UTP--glucose-1-phosphate uridylyltransferase GalU n=1 Tax=Thioalkalivibrio thiocyanodenitrificans TaxID=243063 RepID=UPI0003710F87|nr:UTP--glucose-1-phosphate uridylyltransferase GalU [Thioalkalivibrio thiocyanodenitrificans]